MKPVIDVQPDSRVTFRGLFDQLTPMDVELKSTSSPFKIQQVETNIKDKISYEVTTVEEGKQYKLKISNLVKQGVYNGFIKIQTDMAQKPEVNIWINGYIEGDIAVKPQTLLIGKLANKQDARLGKVLVINNRGKDFKITNLEYDKKLIDVVQKPLPEDTKGYSLEITPKTENVPVNNQLRTILAIRTDASGDIEHEVQVHIMNAEGAAQPQQPPQSKESQGGEKEGAGAKKQ